MILLLSGIASSLHRWEIAEYVAEGFVILGCAGELIALIRRIPRSYREQIETWSTVVLVIALTIGLKCLMKTNELSGMVIGSLGEEAERADEKARKAVVDSNTAISQSKDALSRASAAQASLAKAEGEAKGAQRAASNALSLAKGARQEADSFERAKERLERKVADRILSEEQLARVRNALMSASLLGEHATIVWYSQNFEAARFASQIESAVRGALWVTRIAPLDPSINQGSLPVVAGVLIMTEPPDRSKKAGDALLKALRREDVTVDVLPFDRGRVAEMYLKSNDPEDSRILVIVGSHP